MSSHKRSFQCFNAIGGEGSHKSSLPFKHCTSRLPRIHHHGMVAHHEPLEECCFCSHYTQAQEAMQTQVTPLCHTHTPCHHQYVLRGPTRPEENPVAHSGHILHHRHNKTVVLVKNSDPSSRKTIVLHHRSLRSFGLFLEEVSELMHYHIRKLCTLEGRKIDNVQSLMQCPSVLVCVGREPSHQSIVENFHETSDDKLPSVKSRSSGCNEEHGGLPTKKSATNQQPETDRSTTQSVPSDKSLPDGTDSPDNVESCPHTGDGMRDDEIEKRVRVNKDGSLSMEMKVRFRLPNDETIHWSTEVRKTSGGTCEFLQRHNNPRFAQVSYSESENISAGEQDEAYITRRYQRHRGEEPHCPHCCSDCQDYDIWKNVPGTQGATRCIQTSSSSASSHTMVSRKTVVEGQTSEEHIEQVVQRETCVEQTVEAAEIVEYCTIRSGTCSPKCMVQSFTPDNCEVCVDSSPNDQVNVNAAQIPEQKEQTESASSASSELFTYNEEDYEEDIPLSASRASSQTTKPEREETTGSAVLDTASSMQHSSPSSTDRTSNASGHSSMSRKSTKSYTCNCGVSKDLEDDLKRQVNAQSDEEDGIQRDQPSAMSVKSKTSGNESEEIQNTESEDLEEKRSKSAMSVHSNASTKCDVLEVTAEEMQAHDDKETQERPLSSMSRKSSKTEKSMKSEVAAEQHESEADVDEERAFSSMSSKSKASIKSKGSRVSSLLDEEQDEEVTEQRMSKKAKASFEEEEGAEEAGEDQERVPSVMSTQSKTSESSDVPNKESDDNHENENDGQLTEDDEAEARASSALSEKSVKSKSSAISSKSKEFKDSSEESNNNEEIAERAPSAMSAKSAKSNASAVSTKSYMSSKSAKSTQSSISAKSNMSERAPSILSSTSAKSAQSNSSAMSKKSRGSAVPSENCGAAPEESVVEEETEGRSETAMSVQSVESSISSDQQNQQSQMFLQHQEDPKFLKFLWKMSLTILRIESLKGRVKEEH
ncbi:retinitis pigmentosa 1-like 1 protein [Anarrhichthys ocellatus]|uniref:retinitis pigmentosa 1-like 1 protein n=1 Tax=Anarrhichthys ocellatus TaxID=433405 RepID=UPI0012EE4980|nr:retinitis pigmentosa 1-like 1 protein [Anarrhichthys ocellatus]